MIFYVEVILRSTYLNWICFFNKLHYYINENMPIH